MVSAERFAETMTTRKAQDTKDIISMILQSPIRRGPVVEADGKVSMEELSQSNTTVMTRIIAQMAFNAARGDVKSAEFIFKYSGQIVPQNHETYIDAPIIINDMDNRLEPVPPSPLALPEHNEEK